MRHTILQGSESFPDIESVHAALLKVFRDLKRAERYETVNPTLLKHAFAKHQSSFWGCIQQVFYSQPTTLFVRLSRYAAIYPSVCIFDQCLLPTL